MVVSITHGHANNMGVVGGCYSGMMPDFDGCVDAAGVKHLVGEGDARHAISVLLQHLRTNGKNKQI